ncbi:MAG: hypothetical protein RIQ54_476 [Candidatus Parcubacteria bacterium]|jgi:hypothetical protein
MDYLKSSRFFSPAVLAFIPVGGLFLLWWRWEQVFGAWRDIIIVRFQPDMPVILDSFWHIRALFFTFSLMLLLNVMLVFVWRFRARSVALVVASASFLLGVLIFFYIIGIMAIQ